MNIESGVEVTFYGKDTNLIIEGTLSATGTNGNEIIFTEGLWDGVILQNNTADASVLDYVTIQNAKYGLYFNKCSAAITNSTIQNCSNRGIYVYNASPTIDSNTITNITQENGIYVYYRTNANGITITNNTITNCGDGNDWDGGILIYAFHDVSTSTSYTVSDDTNPIEITFNDINNNNYNGVFIYNRRTNSGTGDLFMKIKVEDNDVTANRRYGIRVYAEGYNTSAISQITGTLNGNYIQNYRYTTSDAGVYIYSNSTDSRGQLDIQIRRAQLLDNYRRLYHDASYFTNINAQGNDIVGNVLYGVQNNWTTASIDATNCWWGDASGPSGVGPGIGDSVSDYVLYNPWLGESTRIITQLVITTSPQNITASTPSNVIYI